MLFHYNDTSFIDIPGRLYCNLVKTVVRLTVMPKGNDTESLCFSIVYSIYATLVSQRLTYIRFDYTFTGMLWSDRGKWSYVHGMVLQVHSCM